jgi:hypothetical protein
MIDELHAASHPTGVDRFVVELDFIAAWSGLVFPANDGKRGRPFRFPDTFFDLLAFVRQRTGLDYRGLGAVAADVLSTGRRRLAGLTGGSALALPPTAPHFTQIRRRLVGRVPVRAPEAPVVAVLGAARLALVAPAEWERRTRQVVGGRGWFEVAVPAARVSSGR